MSLMSHGMSDVKMSDHVSSCGNMPACDILLLCITLSLRLWVIRPFVVRFLPKMYLKRVKK